MSVDADYHVGRLDDDIYLLALLQTQALGGCLGYDGDDLAASRQLHFDLGVYHAPGTEDSAPIVVERAVYWNDKVEGTCSTGYQAW